MLSALDSIRNHMIKSLIRSNLKNFQAYSSARSLYPAPLEGYGARQKGVFLDGNENPLGSSVDSPVDSQLNRYPDPTNTSLRMAIGKFLGISEKNIFVGNGSDEAIDLLIRLFVEPDEEIVILEPTYGMYRVAGETSGVKVRSFLMEADFRIDFSKLINQTSRKTKIIFCCSPNNPTGTLIPAEDVEELCKRFKGVVVVDEAYIEFASKPSLAAKVSKLKNLVILRTFSKAWGLAGIRVGYAVANERVIDYLNKIKAPYNLNRISSKLAARALGQSAKMLKWRKIILQERKRLAGVLAKLGFKVFPSEANFLLVRHSEASRLAKKLAKNYGIIVRDFGSKPSLRDCIRISVGAPKENKLLIKSLKEII